MRPPEAPLPSDNDRPPPSSSSRRDSGDNLHDHIVGSEVPQPEQDTSEDGRSQCSGARKSRVPFEVTEHPVSKDHRSFTANVFGSVAFRMLEWLTPVSLATMARNADALDLSNPKDEEETGGVELAIKSLDDLNASLADHKPPGVAEDLAKDTEESQHSTIPTLPSSSTSTSRSTSSGFTSEASVK